MKQRGKEGMAMAMAMAWAILMALSLSLSAEVVPYHAGSFGVIQSIQDPKYKIEFHPLGTPTHVDPEQEIIYMTDRDGQKYECVLPKQPAEHDAKRDETQPLNNTSLNKEKRARKTPDDLLDAMKDQCFLRLEGWWTYEFCYHGKFRQIHLENKKIVQEFILGVYDSEATTSLRQNLQDVYLQKDPRSKSAAQRYHSHLYTNGTLCDITNKPRETEVRFVCADSGKIMINSITETSTCKYTVIFHAPMLCKHPLFQEERPQVMVINCSEVSPKKENPLYVEEVEETDLKELPSSDDVAISS